ncbi:MAG TPA: hypothetical protein DCM05_11755 [Elusimicrobia bacterium]|nr:hypothetical protein [Elusimicrobiota bacterium]
MTRASAALLCALVLLLGGRPGRAQDFTSRAVGTAGSEFLNLDVGPRGIAMGGAYSAIVSDAYSMYWNPAGLSRVPRLSLAAMHNEYLAGIRMQYLAYAQRLNEHSVLAGGLRFMDAGEIDHTDVNGNAQGSFRPRNYVYEFGWGQSIADLTDAEHDVSLGLTGRYFHSDLLAHANGYAGDVGIQTHYTETAMPFSFSFVAQNMGSGQKFDYVRDTLPFRARLGAALNPIPQALLSMEAVFPVSNDPFGAVGAELGLDAPNGVKGFLRGGFNTLNQFSGLDGFKGLSLGVGLKLINLTVDYSFVPFGMLGETHRFSLCWDLPAKHSRRFRAR